MDTAEMIGHLLLIIANQAERIEVELAEMRTRIERLEGDI